MMNGNGFGTNWKGLYVTSLLDAHSNWRSRADELSDSLKISMFVGQYFLKHYRGHYYAKAQNLARQLKLAYDAALDRSDLLLMPTRSEERRVGNECVRPVTSWGWPENRKKKNKK